MTAPAIPSFPALDGLPVTQAHADQCARFGHATGGNADRYWHLTLPSDNRQ